MPPLKEMLRSDNPQGFAAAESPMSSPPPSQAAGERKKANPYIRCPLPPFNAGPDTLRQFNESGIIPTRRVIPLPVQTSASGGGTTVNQNTTIIQQGSGGGSSTPTLVSASVSFSFPALLPGQSFVGQVSMAKSFQLLQAAATVPIELRIYSNAGVQGGDLPRATDTAVAFEVIAGIITDVVFDTTPYVWNWQNRIAANADSPQSTLVYVTVINPSQDISTASGILTITYLPLES